MTKYLWNNDSEYCVCTHHVTDNNTKKEKRVSPLSLEEFEAIYFDCNHCKCKMFHSYRVDCQCVGCKMRQDYDSNRGSGTSII
jgi:hypothetical protein